MIDFLSSLDRSVFYFFNTTIANPFFDATMPYVTDWHKFFGGRILFALLWILLMWKGGKKGRILGLLIFPLITLSDQFSSAVIKPIFARPRPCHVIDGQQVIQHLRLLVDCGSGYAFPSSHATNNFALATFFSLHYRRWTWLWMMYAALMGVSRIVVGVHFPSDILGGAIIGALCAMIVNAIWSIFAKKYPVLAIDSFLPNGIQE